MFVQLQRKTRIKSQRLDVVFAALWLGIFLFWLWAFVSGRQYTTTIVSNVVVRLNHNLTSTLNMPADASAQKLCNQSKSSSKIIRCQEFCQIISPFLKPNDTSCEYPYELVNFLGFNQVLLTLSRTNVQTGIRLFRETGLITLREDTLMGFANFPVSLDYMVTLSASVPPFLAGLNSAVRPMTTAHTSAMVVLDRNGLIWKRFEPGTRLSMTAAELLWLARPHGGEDLILEQFRKLSAEGNLAVNVTPESLFGTPSTFPPWVFFEGADIGGEMQCYNDKDDVHHIMSQASKLDISFDRPVCLLSLVLYEPRGVVSVKVTKQPGLHLTSGAVGLKLKFVGQPGVYRAWDYSSIVSHIVSAFVLLKIPSILIHIIALNFLGHMSKVYRGVTIHEFHLEQQCAAVALQLMHSTSQFHQLADLQGLDSEGNPEISTKKIYSCLSEALKHAEQLDADEIATLSTACVRSFSGSASSVALKGYQQACLLNEGINLPNMVKLLDQDRRRLWSEKLFTPPVFYTRQSFKDQSDKWENQDCSRTNLDEGDSPCSISQKEEQAEPWPEACENLYCQIRMISLRLAAMEARVQQLEHKRCSDTPSNLSMSSSSVETINKSEMQCTSKGKVANVCNSHNAQATHQLESERACTEIDSLTPRSSYQLQSLKMSLCSMQQALVKLTMQQQTSFQESVTHAIEAILQKICDFETVLHDACINMHRHTASLNLLVAGTLDDLQGQSSMDKGVHMTPCEVENGQTQGSTIANKEGTMPRRACASHAVREGLDEANKHWQQGLSRVIFLM